MEFFILSRMDCNFLAFSLCVMARSLSTAFVVMGRDRADALLAEWQNPSWRAIWCEEACPVVDSQTVETAESQAARL